MKQKVIIVESPAKARTISRFLKDFSVLSSYGHIRDLPRSKLGVEIKKNFAPQYRVLPQKKAVISQLKKAVKDAEVYLATDFDREGEAIAWHLQEILKLKDPKRITFHEITPRAIKESLKKPRQILEDLVGAQKARRIIDRLFGYKLSPFLWRKILRGLSAGRVQSAALRLLVEREKEIKKFQPKDYFVLQADFKKGSQFSARLHQIGKKVLDKFYFKNKKEVEKIKEKLKNREFQVQKIISRSKFVSPPAPFITATLQQDAFQRLGFTAKKTMFLAQQLYEGVEISGKRIGLITYMRTDSPTLAQEAVEKIRAFVQKKFGSKFLSKSIKKYKAPKNAQEAHEAIRPTDIGLSPDKVKPFLEKDQLRLYELIFWRTVASQMKPAEFKENTIYLLAQADKDYVFLAKGLKQVFESFLKIYPYWMSTSIIPNLTEGEKLKPLDLQVLAFQTKPKARYTEASLVKKLKDLGIGRPSTYAPIIDILYKRHYIERKKRYLFPTDLGEKVTEFLLKHFPHLVDYQFTAEMEKELDEIALGKREWSKVVAEFYGPLEKLLKKKDAQIKKTKETEVEVLKRKCPKCGGELVVKFGRFGKFISCRNFPKCNYKESLNNQDNLEQGLSAKEKKRLKELRREHPKCPECGGKLVLRKSRFGYFLGCANYPKCRLILPFYESKKNKKDKIK